MPLIFDLLEHEGLCVGGSSGINIAGAIRLAKDLGPGHTIVTVLCDYGTRYQSKLFRSGLLALEKAAGAGMARAQVGNLDSVRKELEFGACRPTACSATTRICKAARRASSRSPSDGGIVLDRTVFYATSGGQPGDSGTLTSAAGALIPIATAVYTDARQDRDRARAGAGRSATLGRRRRSLPQSTGTSATPRMRMHTALHLLSAVLPYRGDRRLGRRRRRPARFRHSRQPGSTRTRSPQSSAR